MLTVTSNARALDRDIVATAARLGDVRVPMLRWAQRTAIRARENARAKPGRRFWRDIARSVSVASIGTDAMSVHSAHVAAAQKQFGGVIESRPGGPPLTIPIATEARGRRASEFEGGGRDLFTLPSKSGGADAIGILGYSDGGGEFHALFALRRRTRRQDAKPWWPTQAETIDYGRDEFARYLSEVLRSGSTGGARA